MSERPTPEGAQDFKAFQVFPESVDHSNIQMVKETHPIPQKFEYQSRMLRIPLMEYMSRVDEALQASGKEEFSLSLVRDEYYGFLKEAMSWYDEGVVAQQGEWEKRKLKQSLYGVMKNNVIGSPIIEYRSAKTGTGSGKERELRYLDKDNMVLAFGTMYIRGHLWGESGGKGQSKNLPAIIVFNLLPDGKLSSYLAERLQVGDQKEQRYNTETSDVQDGSEWLLKKRLPEAGEDLKHITGEKIEKIINDIKRNHPTWFVDTGEGINPQVVPLSEDVLHAVRFLTRKGKERLSQGSQAAWDTSYPEMIRSLRIVQKQLGKGGGTLHKLYDSSRSQVLKKVEERKNRQE